MTWEKKQGEEQGGQISTFGSKYGKDLKEKGDKRNVEAADKAAIQLVNAKLGSNFSS